MKLSSAFNGMSWPHSDMESRGGVAPNHHQHTKMTENPLYKSVRAAYESSRRITPFSNLGMTFNWGDEGMTRWLHEARVCTTIDIL